MNTTGYIAEAIRTQMETQGISRTHLAQESGIPATTLYRKLKGGDDFKFSEVERIASALAVAPSCFLPPTFRPSALADSSADATPTTKKEVA